MNEHTGECLCGACRYIIKTEKPHVMFLCHCSRCRKETGTIHGASAFFNDAQLLWEKGQDNVAHFKLENTKKERAFCKTCASSLPRYEGENTLVLPVGTLDDDAFLNPTAHIHHKSRASWVDKVHDLKRFDELPTAQKPTNDSKNHYFLVNMLASSHVKKIAGAILLTATMLIAGLTFVGCMPLTVGAIIGGLGFFSGVYLMTKNTPSSDKKEAMRP